MRRSKGSLSSDIAFLLVLLLLFVCVVYMGGDSGRYLQNLVFLNVAFLIAIVTYFTTVTTGLLLNIIFLFGYGTFVLYRTVTLGETIGLHTYFWLIMTPLLTVMVWMFTSAMRSLQMENAQLQTKTRRLATLDENTELRTMLTFQKDVSVFAGISARYDIPLTLLVIQVKYWDELRRLIPDDQIADAVYDLSKLGQTSIRTNDAMYILDRDKATWGILLFTDGDGAKVVIERIRQKLADFNETEFSAKYKVNLGLKIGALQYDEESVPTPFEFIAQAKKQLEYDV